MKTIDHGIIYNSNVFFVQPMELPCDDTKKFSLESVPKQKSYSLCREQSKVLHNLLFYVFWRLQLIHLLRPDTIDMVKHY